MVRSKIRELLREIFELNSKKKEELKNKFNLSFRHKKKGGSLDKYNTILKYTFKTKKYKYIIDVEIYDLDLYLVSFYPKLNTDFELKQEKLRSLGRPYHTKYSYQTKEFDIGDNKYDIRKTIELLNLLMTLMDDLLIENPNASFAFFGAPNEYSSNEEEDFFNTKRIRIYNEMLKRNFNNTHNVLSFEEYSGGLLLNRKMLELHPELRGYSKQVLEYHV